MLTKRFAPIPRKIGYSLLLLAALLVAAAGLAASLNPAQAQTANGKYDTDGDRLIEISSWQQFHAVRFDLDGDGRVDDDSNSDDYAAGYPVGSNESVCDRSCNGYELSQSLDFNNADDYGAAGWIPIRDFNAIFDGNDLTISNLYLDVNLQSSQDNAGLFGSIGGSAVIKNVGLLDADVSGVSYVGGLVGKTGVGYSISDDEVVAIQSRISHSHVTGAVQGTGNYIGGLVGENVGTVSDSHSTAAVSGASDSGGYVGGLVGSSIRYSVRINRYSSVSSAPEITKSYATGPVTGYGSVGGLVGVNHHPATITEGYAAGIVQGTGNYIGGLAGLNYGTVTKSYATGAVTGAKYVGGLAGESQYGSHEDRATIRSSYATGDVTATERYGYVGGLVGRAGYWSSGRYSSSYYSTISNSYAIGRVSGDEYAGGLVGYGAGRSGTTHYTLVAFSYWNLNSADDGVGSGDLVLQDAGKTPAELQAPTGRTGIYARWSDGNWDFGTPSQYPALKADLNGDDEATAAEFGPQGRGAAAPLPGAPAISSVTPGVGSLIVAWSAPSSNATGITAYDLRHILTSADETVDANWNVIQNVWTGSGARQYTLTGLTGGTSYDVQVRAVNSGGDGLWSATATGTPTQASAATSTRSFSPSTVAPGGQVTVTVTAVNYGFGGRVTETLPAGFSYVSSTHALATNPVDGDSQKVAFALFGETSITYTVTASGVDGLYTFSGTLTDSGGSVQTVGGDTTVTVGGDAQPSVTVSYAGTDPAAPVRTGTAIPVAVAFSKTVTGFTVNDVTVGNGTAGNFSGSGAAYTFNVTPNAIGQVTVDIAAGVAADANGNGNTAAVQLQLGVPYDDNRNRVIEKSEVIQAFNAYLTGGLDKSHLITLFNLYLTGQRVS